MSYHGTTDFAKGGVVLFGGAENADVEPLADVVSDPDITFFDVAAVSELIHSILSVRRCCRSHPAGVSITPSPAHALLGSEMGSENSGGDDTQGTCACVHVCSKRATRMPRVAAFSSSSPLSRTCGPARPRKSVPFDERTENTAYLPSSDRHRDELSPTPIVHRAHEQPRRKTSPSRQSAPGTRKLASRLLSCLTLTR